MKTRILILAFLSLTFISANSQTNKPSFQSNQNIDFETFLEGVKYAYLLYSDQFVESVMSSKNISNAEAVLGFTNYLKEIGFEEVKWGRASDIPSYYTSLCDLTIVSTSWNYSNNVVSGFKISYISCNKDIFTFENKKNIFVPIYGNLQTTFYNKCLDLYEFKKQYDPNKRLVLPSEMTEYNETNIKKIFSETGVDQIEGIYEKLPVSDGQPKYRLGIKKTDLGYEVIYLAGANNYLDWHDGEKKSALIPTGTVGLFKAEWKMSNKAINDNTIVTFEPGMMNVIIADRDKNTYIKLFPSTEDATGNIKNTISSGTGFAISSNGLIATNAHVITDANTIHIRGINGDFSTRLKAKLILEDKNNDLAIIQVIDSNFREIKTIPYMISNNLCDVGSSVFVLGFPLKAVMGDEIKLTNGIISSKSGFKGDITSYQISVPIQPGNSGGPLFDSNGNIVGIVNAKLSLGENVSYAIKSFYLNNLVDQLPVVPKLSKTNILAGKQLPDQVKLLNGYIFIIEIQ